MDETTLSYATTKISHFHPSPPQNKFVCAELYVRKVDLLVVFMPIVIIICILGFGGTSDNNGSATLSFHFVCYVCGCFFLYEQMYNLMYFSVCV